MMDSFKFRQFSVFHAPNVMKVGTDGVLLGAWAPLPHEGRILDIGTGTGLIALMAAQRSRYAKVVAMDISDTAVGLARQNVAASPFAERVETVCQDILDYHPGCKFDAILSNPPFYTEDTLPPEKARAMARNAASLPTDGLVTKAAELLTAGGLFSVVVPAAMMLDMTAICLEHGLYLCRRMYVRTVKRRQPKRVLLTYSNAGTLELVEEEMLLMEDGKRSAAYAALTEDFYLPTWK